MKRAARTAILLVFLLICLGAGCRSRSQWHKYTLLYFDTVCDIEIFCPTSGLRESQDALHRVFSAIETQFSPGREDLSSKAVIELFGLARRLHSDSGGYLTSASAL